jgi:hypothetical protein
MEMESQLPSRCLLQFLDEVVELGEHQYESGSVEDLVCDIAGTLGCQYSCTVKFGDNNEVEEVIEDSGSPVCL